MRRSINIPIANASNAQTQYSLPEITNSVVILGANGSGKTRFGSFLEDINRDVHRITAQKSLMMPDLVGTTSLSVAQDNFLYGGSDNSNGIEWLQTAGKKAYRYGNNPNTYLTNDFHALMSLLFSEEFVASTKFKEDSRIGDPENLDTKLDIVINIWQRILPHRKIKKGNGLIEVESIGNYQHFGGQYNGSQMSDGERVIFYLIAEAVCVKQESILIIDEPEIHIHKSVMKNLFDEIERVRPDVLFIYLTHDIDFAVSRIDSYKLWLKSYKGYFIWDFEPLQVDNQIPEEIYLEILGSRKPILFVEGDRTSLDYL